MIESVMQKITFVNPPKRKTAEGYRRYLRSLFNYSCAYCTITEAEAKGATFNIEHFRPKTHFDSLKSECTNLRYSCPRCNSYKHDIWISKEEGCSRNCKECSSHVCKTDIPRFVDVSEEEPSAVFRIDDNDRIVAYNDSKVAKFTIDTLRLNRAQLVKMRYVRRYMESWKTQLKNDLNSSERRLREIEQRKKAFVQLKEKVDLSSKKNSLCVEAIDTVFHVLELEEERISLQIISNIQRLENLEKNAFGADE